jgi:aspartate 1-decarboxylase
MIRVIRAKMHGIRVTGSDLNYHGSITLDPDHCREAGIYPLEFVEVWNKSTGARLTTYVIFGKAGSRCCILNGAAARTCQPGDEIIIAASDYIAPGDLPDMHPRVLTFTKDNAIDRRLSYRVETADEFYDFHIDDL